MKSSISHIRSPLVFCSRSEPLQWRRSAVYSQRHLSSRPKETFGLSNVRWSEEDEKTNKYVLESPLSDDCYAMQGRMKKSFLRKYPRKEEAPLKHPSSYYDLSSTRPPILQLPEPLNQDASKSPPPIQERVKYLYHVARSYFTFYKTGLKAIWSNYKEYRNIAPRAKAFDKLPPTADLIPKMKAAFDRGEITRREYQIYLRTRRDLRRLLPFGLILAIFGEFSPLILLPLGPKVIPFPCLIPTHVIRECKPDETHQWTTFGDAQPGARLRSSSRVIPSYTTWQSWYQQLRQFDDNVKPEPGLERMKIILPTWYSYKHSRFSPQRPLADALLILLEGGVKTLDNKEVLLWVWSTKDQYLSWMLKDHWFTSQKRSIERGTFQREDYIKMWEGIDDIDLHDVRQELELTLKELIKRVDFYLKTGLDYNRSEVVKEAPRFVPHIAAALEAKKTQRN